ncbi:hypothetical protein [Sphingomonas humi]|uniref:Uncharacterized protein n=1 Tax=Sphingomonas humi TaxID=335630 RepID=A0ABP7S7X4_9SPHN
MIVQKLLDWFDQNVTQLHIDVNAVRDKLIEIGVQDEIEFHFVKMDKDKVRGLLYRYTTHSAPYAHPTFHSRIIIPREMGEESEAWQRLVAVKELLHITDCDRLTAASPEAVNNLFEKFSIPPELRTADEDEPFGGSFLNDRVRIYFALAVLVPAKPRDKLRELFAAKVLTAREIAEIAAIPVRYVRHVLDDDFEALIGTLIKWEISEQPDAHAA